MEEEATTTLRELQPWSKRWLPFCANVQHINMYRTKRPTLVLVDYDKEYQQWTGRKAYLCTEEFPDWLDVGVRVCCINYTYTNMRRNGQKILCITNIKWCRHPL